MLEPPHKPPASMLFVQRTSRESCSGTRALKRLFGSASKAPAWCPKQISNTLSPFRRSAASRSTACSDSGTLCSRLDFIRPAGMVHTQVARSISDHLAPSTSLDRQAVRLVNRRARSDALRLPRRQELVAHCRAQGRCPTGPPLTPNKPARISSRFGHASGQVLTLAIVFDPRPIQMSCSPVANTPCRRWHFGPYRLQNLRCLSVSFAAPAACRQ